MPKFDSSFGPYKDLYETLSLVAGWTDVEEVGMPQSLKDKCREALQAARRAQGLPEHAELVERARQAYTTDDVQIDEKPHVSRAGEGVFVSAWVWVPYESEPKPGGWGRPEEDEENKSSEATEEDERAEFLTEMQKPVYEYVRKNADPEIMDCVDFDDIHRAVGEPAGWSKDTTKGVLGSLIAGEYLVLEDWDANARRQVFYWTPEQYRLL